MKLINIADVPVTVRDHVRTGRLEYQTIATGTPGTPENFTLVLCPLRADYSTPRHRHNFEQIRFQIEGEFTYGRAGTMRPGMIGYFPEGTPYGPTHSNDATLLLNLQFGGPSGSGYLSEEEQLPILTEMKKIGRFEGGVYTIEAPDGGKRNRDGYEAMWEKARQQRLVYPKPRYQEPILIRPSSFDWIAIAGQSGAAYKRLGVFSERGTRIGCLRLERGARATLEDNSIYFTTTGAGISHHGAWLQYSAFYLKHGEAGEIEATNASEFLHLGFPDLRDLHGQPMSKTPE